MNGYQGNDYLANAVLLTAMRRERRELLAVLDPQAPAQQEAPAQPSKRWYLLGRRPLVVRLGHFLVIARVARLDLRPA